MLMWLFQVMATNARRDDFVIDGRELKKRMTHQVSFFFQKDKKKGRLGWFAYVTPTLSLSLSYEIKRKERKEEGRKEGLAD